MSTDALAQIEREHTPCSVCGVEPGVNNAHRLGCSLAPVYIDDETTDEKIDRLIARMDATENKITEFIDTVKPYLAEVMPLLERIESSPMFRMIVGGKKK